MTADVPGEEAATAALPTLGGVSPTHHPLPAYRALPLTEFSHRLGSVTEAPRFSAGAR